MAKEATKPEREIIVKDARFEVTKTVLGNEETESGTMEIRPFETHPATVSVKGGATVNLGNYESARVDVLLTVPCYLEEVDDIYPKVKEWVDQKLATEYQELKQAAGKK